VRLTRQIEVNDKKGGLLEHYHMGMLYGNVISKDFLWSRDHGGAKEGICHLKAGENTVKMSFPAKGRAKEFQLNKLLITNDHSFVPNGKLSIY
jgi:hypothetical protein